MKRHTCNFIIVQRRNISLAGEVKKKKKKKKRKKKREKRRKKGEKRRNTARRESRPAFSIKAILLDRIAVIHRSGRRGWCHQRKLHGAFYVTNGGVAWHLLVVDSLNEPFARNASRRALLRSTTNARDFFPRRVPPAAINPPVVACVLSCSSFRVARFTRTAATEWNRRDGCRVNSVDSRSAKFTRILHWNQMAKEHKFDVLQNIFLGSLFQSTPRTVLTYRSFFFFFFLVEYFG